MPGSGMLRASRSCKSQWMWWSPTIGHEELIWWGRVLLAITIDHHKPKGLWGSEACRRAKTHAFLEMNRGVNIHVVFFRVLLWNAGWQGLFSRICRLSRLSQWWSMMGCDGFQLYSAEFAIPVVSAVCRYPCDGPCEIWMSRKGTPCRCHCYTV